MPARWPQTEEEWKEMVEWVLKEKPDPLIRYPSIVTQVLLDDAKFKWDNPASVWWKDKIRPLWEKYCDSFTPFSGPIRASSPPNYLCPVCYRLSPKRSNCEWCDDTRYRNSEKYKEEQKQKAKEYVRQAMLVQLRAYPRHCEADMKINSGVVDNNLCVIYSCLHCDKRETFKLTPRK